jgi:nucleoside-diphosphate-sugar epimerase
VNAFVTGATGFIGGHLARALRDRGDEVVALVRSPSKGADLRATGCELVEGDLGDVDAISRGVKGCDAAFHVAADYRVGVSKADCERMRDTNVRGTERVLDAAIAAGVRRIVYVSTIGVFGNTGGEIVDETYRPPGRDFLSCYEETKYLAHEAARERGDVVVIVQPGGVYGPGDTSPLALLIEQARRGRMVLVPLADSGFNFVHVDDVAQGILLAHDKGRPGESYVLGGELARTEDLVRKVTQLSGRRAPLGRLPTPVLRAAIPFGPLIGRALGTGPNIRESIRSGAGVTYWASDEKARRELGYSPRDLDTGLTQTLAAV